MRNTLLNFRWVAMVLLLIGLFFSQQTDLHAQGKDKVIYLSGLIISGDSSYGIPGVHIYIEEAGVGTVSNSAGLFRIRALPGDTITFSHIAYATQTMVVPVDDYEMAMTVMIDMEADDKLLPMVTIFPYPSEDVFKEAFLALDLETVQEKNMRRNLSSEKIAEMAKQIAMDGGSNHRVYMNQQVNYLHNRYFMPTLSLTDPFAWARFIKSVKNGDFKKKKK
ncbi:MAG: carboxypeptidase-like regulatory domain-containing protein [Flammeovirgaceae bacterium]